jgi:hypothetical protein
VTLLRRCRCHCCWCIDRAEQASPVWDGYSLRSPEAPVMRSFRRGGIGRLSPSIALTLQPGDRSGNQNPIGQIPPSGARGAALLRFQNYALPSAPVQLRLMWPAVARGRPDRNALIRTRNIVSGDRVPLVFGRLRDARLRPQLLELCRDQSGLPASSRGRSLRTRKGARWIKEMRKRGKHSD